MLATTVARGSQLACRGRVNSRRECPVQRHRQPPLRLATQRRPIHCRAAAKSTQSEAGERLAEWLAQWKHDDCGVAVKPEDDGNGRVSLRSFCAVATRAIAKRSILVSVPRQAIILPADVRTTPLLDSVASWAVDQMPPSGLTDWQLLCLWLIWERQRGAESPFAPYMTVLPTEEAVSASLAHPLLWPDDVCDALLGGSTIRERLRARVESCRRDLQALQTAVEGASAVAGVSAGDAASLKLLHKALTERSARWAAAMVLSRAFYFDEGDEIDEDFDNEAENGEWGVAASAGSVEEGILALVPWADSLNHSSEAGDDSCLWYNPDLKAACLSAHRDYAPGDQVFDSYGPGRDPGNLFLDFGFADDPIRDIRADLAATALGEPAVEAGAALLRAVGLSPEGATATFGVDGPGESVLAWARAASATEEDLIKAGWLSPSGGKKGKRGGGSVAKAHVAMARFSDEVSESNEREARKRLLDACEAQLVKLDAAQGNAQAQALYADALRRTGAVGQAALRVVAAEAAALRGSVSVLRRAQQMDEVASSAAPAAP